MKAVVKPELKQDIVDEAPFSLFASRKKNTQIDIIEGGENSEKCLSD